MAAGSPFSGCQTYTPRATLEVGGVDLPAFFGEAADEYRLAGEHVALFDRSDRGIVAATGGDRREWLHNLVTNAVKTLDENAGVYALATDLRGRVQFDLNVLCLANTLWLDMRAADARGAIEHFERYLISEDVRLTDATGKYARLGCAGPQAAEVAGRLGAQDFSEAAALSSFALEDGDTRLVRHDFAGVPGFELIVPRAQAHAWWRRLVDDCGVRPAGQLTLDVLRIEAGIPWSGRDIDDQVVAPETGQIGRGISYDKGCYLGQEVIERMRSRGSIARRLVGLRSSAGEHLTPPVALVQVGKEVGRVTSWTDHPINGGWIGLGYLRTNLTDTDGIVAGDPPAPITIVNITE